MPLRSGVHRQLEDEADRILKASMRDASPEEKGAILTSSQQNHRRSKEVFVSTGVPDPSVRNGTYGRSLNTARPDLNSAPSGVRSSRVSVGSGGGASSLAKFVHDQLEE